MTGAGDESHDFSILYVEDETDTRELVRDILVRKYRRLTVEVATDGENGLELFRELQPDIVITDLSMPLLDGIAMSREIRQLSPETHIIAVTAHSETKYLLDAIEIGINHYILKPIVNRKLFAVLDACIEAIRMRRLLKAQEEHIRKLSSAVEGSSCSVMITDAHGIIEYVNPKLCSVTGYSADEVVGKTPRIMNSGQTPAGTYEQLWNAITDGREWHGELLNRKKNGELFWESVSISPSRDDSEASTHFVAIKEDVTERKQAAEMIEKLNSELAATAAELEAFNYTVSHDLRTPLTLINGFCQVIQTHYASCFPKKCREYFEDIHAATLRMDRLIGTLLDFSHLSRCELNREPVDLSEFVQRVASDLRQLEPERHITVTVHDGIVADGDPRLLAVLVQNLLGNSFKYTSKKEHAVIEFGVEESGVCPAFFVRDNGTGFDMADAEKLFVPFQRLPGSEDFSGHGIGLATVKRIVQRHGGDIWAKAKPGAGSIFYFTLG
jgi:PAS domain S-box-containing protein